MANFDFMKKIGATNQAVAVLNDQPQLFTTLILVLVGLTIQCVLIWFIHFSTRKPEQMKKKGAKGDAPAAAGGGGGGGRK